MKLILLLVLFVVPFLNGDDDEAILCTARFCSDYIDENPCTSISDYCKIQNSTYNGQFLPSPDPCNCCQFCITNLNENDDCALGETGGVVPDTICGPGLMCDSTTKKCVKMQNTPCTQAQVDYDNRRKLGTLGHYEVRPNCDANGFYESYKCIPGLTCFCVDKNGDRIFGEVPYTSTASMTLKCECSRKYHAALSFLGVEFLHPNQHFRCMENGDYDPLQCIGDNCLCVDTLDGAPTYPKEPFVNSTSISEETLPCFDVERHQPGQYYYECEAKYIDILDQLIELEKSEFDAIFEVVYPSCDLNGKYSAVQRDTATKTDFCADFDGNPIRQFTSDLSQNDGMNCKCARSLLLLQENTQELPDCTENGNFNPVQCRRGKCYCVDEDGAQIGNEEVDFSSKETLSCFV